jgi:hypothetical protein
MMTQPHASLGFTMFGFSYEPKKQTKFVDMECARNNQDFMLFQNIMAWTLL